ncbi:MAG: hypothetical protein MUD09_08440, partial [Desulfobacterales bacterium]|nr:hypothetical protein [Desulfobacterales bacterium]
QVSVKTGGYAGILFSANIFQFYAPITIYVGRSMPIIRKNEPTVFDRYKYWGLKNNKQQVFGLNFHLVIHPTAW